MWLVKTVLPLFFALQSYGQIKIYHHNVAWGRLALSDTIKNKKWKWEFYLQKRTQNQGDRSADLFNESQFTSYWFWLNYQASKSLKISISPFGYFNTNLLIAKPSDAEVPGVKEFRWSGRLEHENKFRFFNMYNRYTMEYRIRDLKHDKVFQPNWRARYMIRLEKPIKLGKKVFTLVGNDELMVQFGKAVKNNPNIFDQNRIYIGFGFEPLKNIKINFGYLYTVQQRPSGTEIDKINTLWGILTFDNVVSQFFKK